MQEHHPDQFLNYFSMAGGTLNAALVVDGKEYTIRDVLDRSLLETKLTNELAYSVLTYSHYLEPGKRWKNKFGEEMSLAILLDKLLRTPEKTCLGTHRLGALARVYARKELKQDKEVAKLWDELERQILEALVRLKQSQRLDGAFEVPGQTPATQNDDFVDVYYTGHSLEWVVLLGNDYCRDDWVVRGFQRLSEAVEAVYRQTYRNLDATGNVQSHFDFDGLSHAVSAAICWKNGAAL